MKKMLGLALLMAGAYSFSANALLTHCRINYSVGEMALFGEIGLGGSGTAKCKDITGNVVKIPLNVQMLGGGLKFGACKAKGVIDAVGVGFELGELFSAVGKVELGTGHKSAGFGAKATPFGLNGSVFYSATKYSPGCIEIGDAEALLITQALPGNHNH